MDPSHTLASFRIGSLALAEARLGNSSVALNLTSRALEMGGNPRALAFN